MKDFDGDTGNRILEIIFSRINGGHLYSRFKDGEAIFIKLKVDYILPCK